MNMCVCVLCVRVTKRVGPGRSAHLTFFFFYSLGSGFQSVARQSTLKIRQVYFSVHFSQQTETDQSVFWQAKMNRENRCVLLFLVVCDIIALFFKVCELLNKKIWSSNYHFKRDLLSTWNYIYRQLGMQDCVVLVLFFVSVQLCILCDNLFRRNFVSRFIYISQKKILTKRENKNCVYINDLKALYMYTFAGTNMNLSIWSWKMPTTLKIICIYTKHGYGLEGFSFSYGKCCMRISDRKWLLAHEWIKVVMYTFIIICCCFGQSLRMIFTQN